MNPNPVPRRTLADVIMEKITEKQTEIQSQYSEIDSIAFIKFTCYTEVNINFLNNNKQLIRCEIRRSRPKSEINV